MLDEPGAATDGDDVVILDVSIRDNYDFDNDLPLYLTLKGNDTVCIRGDAFIYLFTGSGQDTIIADAENVEGSIWAGAGNDTVTSTGGRVSVNGEAGDDTLTGGPLRDSLDGGDGNDLIRGGDGNDNISGGPGDDILYGGYGNDNISGNNGDDTIYGSNGDDEISGNLGSDTLYGGPGNDNISSNQNFAMNPHAATDTWDHDTSGARMFGGPGDDMLWGSNRWDRMQGGPGDDILAGFEGRDYLRGGPGNDQIIGGTNIDDVNGNTGADRIFIQGVDIAQGGFGNDECGGFEWEDITIPASCEREFSTTMAMVNMNMMNGGGD